MDHCGATDRIQRVAMDFFSDPQATATRFDDVIDDLHDVFRCHGIDFGSPEDFFAFGRTMKYHSELRSDVMRVVKFVMDSETNVSFRTLLTVLAVASGGTEVAAGGREMRVPVSMVIESLVGAGDSSPLNGEQPESPAPEPAENEAAETFALERSLSGREESGSAEAAAAGTGVEAVFVEEPARDASDVSIDSAIETAIGSVRERKPLMGRSDSNALAESLSRIEMNSLQLKIYLDSIEQRISRMEPRLENVPPVSVSGPPAAPRDQEGAIFSAVVASATVPSAGRGELAHNEPPRVEPAEPGMAAKSPAAPRKLWRDFAHVGLKRRNVLPVLVGLVILLLAASIFWRVRRDSGSVVVRPVNALVQEPGVTGSSRARPGVPGGSDPATGTGGGSKAAMARDSSVAAVEEAQDVNPAPVDILSDASHGGYAGQQEQRPADADTPSPKKPARVALRSSFSSPPAGDTETTAAATDTSADTDAPDRTTKLNSEPVSDRPVNVSSGVMAANLLSSPKPTYPALASLTHIRGDVVMLAVISKDGAVKDLHVIKGHRLLRGAAKSAVRNWRYRPYTINGVPVDVSTLVSVDFSSQ